MHTCVCLCMHVYACEGMVYGVPCLQLIVILSQAIDSTAVTADAMNALTAVSNNISGYGIVTFPVISLEKISSYANQSMAAISSAEDAFSSLETRLQDLRANISANQVSLCL